MSEVGVVLPSHLICRQTSARCCSGVRAGRKPCSWSTRWPRSEGDGSRWAGPPPSRWGRSVRRQPWGRWCRPGRPGPPSKIRHRLRHPLDEWVCCCTWLRQSRRKTLKWVNYVSWKLIPGPDTMGRRYQEFWSWRDPGEEKMWVRSHPLRDKSCHFSLPGPISSRKFLPKCTNS